MQVHIVKQMPSVKAGYVDPQAIALKVVAYIALAFKNLQQHSTIWLPYNFE